jgi:uracil-DNA glycosylase family 4
LRSSINKGGFVSNQFIEFRNQINAVIARCAAGEMSTEERDSTLRQMQLVDDEWNDVWMLSPQGQWYRQAIGSKQWMPDFPTALVDDQELPLVTGMDLSQLALTIYNCSGCPLYHHRTRAVPGEGNPDADIMLIGEGPGHNEDKQARPFVGASGKLLEQLLNDIGYHRRDVFITNVVKCRPPDNRDPQPNELEACRDYLERQIEVIDPKVIVTLGRFSMYRYFPGAAITKIHGQPSWDGQRLIVPMFHPAAALRNPKWREAITADFNRLPALIKNVVTRRAAPGEADG